MIREDLGRTRCFSARKRLKAFLRALFSETYAS